MTDEPLIAVYVDFENLAYGVRDMKQGDFQIALVLKRLLEKGRIVHKRAYCLRVRERGRDIALPSAFGERRARALAGCVRNGPYSRRSAHSILAAT